MEFTRRAILPENNNERVFIVDIPAKLDIDAVIKRLRLKEGNARLEKIARELAEKALAAAHPRGIYRVSRAKIIDRATVEIDGVRFTSRALSKCLEEQNTVYPLMATAGQELDDLPVERGDLMAQFTLDTVKMVILFSASEYLTDHIKNKHKIGGVAVLNPGEFNDFPISQQKPLFELFGGVAGQIGVSLTSGGSLKPTKSRTGILFPNETGFLSCWLCTQVKCPGRRAAYDAKEFEKYIGTPG
jgi:hypothetical protein